MAQEKDQNVSEISLEETNQLRISLGLKPIPVPTATPVHTVKDVIAKESNSGGSDSLSIEETNRIRASLGLKLLPVPSDDNEPKDDTSTTTTTTTSVDQDTQARENWLKKHSVERKAADEEKIKKNIEEAKDRAARRRKLEGTSLGSTPSRAETGAESSTKSWLQNLRRKQKADSTKSSQASKVDTATSASSYDSTDLKGLKVSHKLSEIQGEVGDVILTLKDSSVLDDDDQEIQLESTELVEKQKLKDKLRAKRGLTQLSDDEDDEGEFKPKHVLSKYDDVIDGDNVPLSSGFTLDGSSTLSKTSKGTSTTKATLNKNFVKEALEFDVEVLSGNYDDGSITGYLGTDYQEAKPAKFKKPKIKKKKGSKSEKSQSSSRKRQYRDEEEEEEQQPDQDIDMENLVVDDDLDLQTALQASRRRAQKQQVKKTRILTPQELAEEIQNEKQEEVVAGEDQGGLVISSTTDFLSIIKQQASNNKESVKSKPRSRRDDSESPEPELPIPDSMEIDDQPIDDESFAESKEESVQGPVNASHIAPDEPTLSGGLGDTLKLLRTHGVLKKQSESDDQEQQRKSDQREWSRKMTRERVRRDIDLVRQREQDRASGKFDNLSQREREELAKLENREREVMEAREAQRRFENYKPNIHLEYRDDSGRILNQKEAYKHMSHQFHGKGPGKGKVEKQLKRDEEEKKMMAQSVFGTSDNTKRTSGAAGVRLQ